MIEGFPTVQDERTSRIRALIAASIGEEIDWTPEDVEISALGAAGVYSIKFFDRLALQIKLGKKVSWIAVKRFYQDKVLEIGAHSLVLTKSKMLRADIPNIDALSMYSGLIGAIFEYEYFASSGRLFGCCSLYVECSNARKCILAIKDLSKACIYRQRLQRGIIYYGNDPTT